ncbi:hypothetical protein ACVWYH_003779 [Bradyrhizobium sp. GM24.11]
MAFSPSDVLIVDQLVVDLRNRILPDQRLLRHQRAEVALNRTHVAVGELEPGAGERVRELIGIFEEAARDLLIGRIHAQREVGRQHRRAMLLRLVERIRNDRVGILGRPLVRTARALRQLPFVVEQVLEEIVAPLRRRGGPGHLDTAGDGITG